MSKFSKLGKSISNIAKRPSLLNLVLTENESLKEEFVKKYKGLETLPQISLEDLTENLEENVELFFLDGASIPTDLVLLKTLAKGRKSYFEIGTWRGESVWNVAKVIEDCTTFNLSAEDIAAFGLDPMYAELHGVLSLKNPKILHLEGNSKTFDFSSLNRKYDLIFIDGDHSYEMVKNDTEKVFADLVHEDTVVVWHDYAFNPEKVRYEVFMGIMDGLPAEYRKNVYHVKNTMCGVFIRKEFKTAKFQRFNNQPYLFDVNIKLKK